LKRRNAEKESAKNFWRL